MMKLQSRNQFPQLLNYLGLTGNAAEIGVAEGYFGQMLLDHWRGNLIQIDPWRILSDPGFSGHGESTNEGQEARYQRMLKIASHPKYVDRLTIMRATSLEASKRFNPGWLDFAYLDAQHDYPSITQDIALWWPKVRSGGVIGGHDYLDGPVHNGSQEYGVKRAVKEHALKYGLEVGVTQETDWPSWFCVKPETHTIRGHNARINIGSIDNSINIA